MSEALRRPIRRNPRLGHALGRTATYFTRRTYGLGVRKSSAKSYAKGERSMNCAVVCHTTFNLKNLKAAISMTYRSTRYLINDTLLDKLAHLPTSYLRIVS